MSKAHQFNSQNAPRGGRRKGAKNKLSAQAMKVIDALMKDFAKHGATAITTMRVERPSEYVKVCADIASRWMIAQETGKVVDNVPAVITVRWLAQPPPPVHDESCETVPLLELQPAATETDDDLLN